ncbi:CrpP-related protein [Nitrosomonas communis]|uniref:Uncharacterized protein n=1 Tax=Nitrosomonas communis TaxID=44574 RepID=A0A1I4QR43_9PROT|nr:CrpP-related protein [Nitrosomonas communis]SFM42166.1 hypothetical protein SAMN05421863_10283 [Nitrosomonas communis]
MNENIQKAGANARAIGIKEIDNPYYKPRNMPAQTGETITVWQDKALAWEFGWKMEDIMRSQSI